MLPTDLFLVQEAEALVAAAVALVAPEGDRVMGLAELSSWKMPPKTMPSLMPAGCWASLVMSAPPLTPFLSTPKWYWPWPLMSLGRGSVIWARGSLPVE